MSEQTAANNRETASAAAHVHVGYPPDGRLRARAAPTPASLAYDHVDDAGDASFPASDPPSWWSGR